MLQRMRQTTHVLILALAVATISVLGGCGYVGSQASDLSVMRDLTLPSDLASLMPYFPSAVRMMSADAFPSSGSPEAKVMVADHVHLPTGGPAQDNVRDWVIVRTPEKPGDWYYGASADVLLFDRQADADKVFEYAVNHMSQSKDTAGGTAGDRYAMSVIKQGVSDLWQPLDHYWSEAVYQKGRVVIMLHEVSHDRQARVKERLMAEMARALGSHRQRAAVP